MLYREWFGRENMLICASIRFRLNRNCSFSSLLCLVTPVSLSRQWVKFFFDRCLDIFFHFFFLFFVFTTPIDFLILSLIWHPSKIWQLLCNKLVYSWKFPLFPPRTDLHFIFHSNCLASYRKLINPVFNNIIASALGKGGPGGLRLHWPSLTR